MSFFKNMTLSKKLLLGFFIILSLPLVGSIFAISVNNSARKTEEESERIVRATESAQQLANHVLRASLALHDYGELKDKKYIQIIETERLDTLKKIKSLREATPLAVVIQALDVMEKEIIPKHTQIADKTIAGIDSNTSQAELDALDRRQNELDNLLHDKVLLVLRAQEDLLDKTLQAGRDARAQITNQLIIFLAGVMAVSLLVVFSSISALRKAKIEIAAASSQLRASSEEQASGAAEQASAVAEITSTMEEVAQTAATIATSTNQVLSAAENASKAMETINSKIAAMAKRIVALGERSQAIGSITALIDDLADQTNLLSLNAAIEAARAGDAGRGFAVVAAEIRKLAERSGGSTKDIRRLIAEIQTETNASVMGVEEAIKSSEKGLEEINQTFTAIKGITFSTQQQRTAATQVVQAMRNIDAVAKQFATSTKQVSDSADQLNDINTRLS